MRGQIRGLKQAQRNAQDGISLIQTAEGALNEIHAILQRMRELAVQSATDTNTDADRLEIQKEVTQLTREIDRIARTTQFNTMELLNGDYSGKSFHIGANMDQTLSVDIADMRAEALGVVGTEPAGEAGEVDGTAGEAGEVDGTAGEAGEVDGTAATIVVESGAKISNVSIDPESELDGIYTLTIAADNSGKVTASLVDSSSNAVGGPVEISSSGGEVTIEGITFTINSTDFPENGEHFDVALTITAFVPADEGDPVDPGDGDGGEVDPDAPFDESTMHGINVDTREAANSALDTIDTAIAKVSEERSKLGAIQNRLEHTIANLGTSAENLQAAEARIRDLDMAEEIMAFTKNNILQQAATAMLAQANMAPQSVLQLLG
jgi:flagellin